MSGDGDWAQAEMRALTGGRGLAGTILVYKVASALSDRGADLDKVEAIAKYVNSQLGTIGIGLEHCHVRLSHIDVPRH